MIFLTNDFIVKAAFYNRVFTMFTNTKYPYPKKESFLLKSPLMKCISSLVIFLFSVISFCKKRTHFSKLQTRFLISATRSLKLQTCFPEKRTRFSRKRIGFSEKLTGFSVTRIRFQCKSFFLYASQPYFDSS